MASPPVATLGVQGLGRDAPTVVSDGARAWLSAPLPSFEAYLAAGGMAPDPLELYKWDLQVGLCRTVAL